MARPTIIILGAISLVIVLLLASGKLVLPSNPPTNPPTNPPQNSNATASFNPSTITEGSSTTVVLNNFPANTAIIASTNVGTETPLVISNYREWNLGYTDSSGRLTKVFSFGLPVGIYAFTFTASGNLLITAQATLKVTY